MSKQSGNGMGDAKNGEIDLCEILDSKMAAFCFSEELSDVTFNIQDKKIPGHRLILATRSKYFRALLFGGLAESKQEVINLEVPIEAFKAILTYVYTGRLSLSQILEENLLPTLCLIHEYDFPELEINILEYMRQILSMDNVLSILNTAKMYTWETLRDACHQFLDRNAKDILEHESFKNLREDTLKEIICRDSFYAPEFQIFTGLSEWCKHNPNFTLKSMVSNIRFPMMSLEELFKVESFGVLDSGTVLEVFKQKTSSTSLPCRIDPLNNREEENVATEGFGARVYENSTFFTKLSNRSYIDYAKHLITENNEFNIIVVLGSFSVINHIKFCLWDGGDNDSRRYSYFAEVSVNKTQWERIADHQSYPCRSWQFLYFPSRPVRYIKLVGTNVTYKQSKIFVVVSLEAYFTAKVPKVNDGIIVPTKNVATIEMGAQVVQGSCVEKYPTLKKVLMFNRNKSYDSNSGYIYHNIGSGSILIQLGQPYVIGSMRLHLRDIDERYYSFYIETSINRKDWEVVVDKRNDDCYSWQNFVFEPRAMSFIKIVGTKSTYGDYVRFENINELQGFQCFYFECPSKN